jgi:hypothetical protein
MRFYYKIILAYFLILYCFSYSFGQNNNIEETKFQIYSIFIYNFSKYIQWPDNYNSDGDFTIAILGDSKIENELKKLASIRKVNGRNISIEIYKSVKDISDKGSHILFIPSESSNSLSEVLKKTNGTSTLIVTDKDGLGKTGSLINFVYQNGKPTFEMNLQALSKRSFKYEQQLKAIAVVIN